jgi:hypothetical protein
MPEKSSPSVPTARRNVTIEVQITLCLSYLANMIGRTD